jgi:hypothetical protein
MGKLFDSSVLDQQVEANATRRDPLPVGETLAQIIELGMSDGLSKKDQKPWARLDVKLEITDADYLDMVPGRPEKVVTSLGVMLDMANGQIKTGANVNVRLGRLREAAEANGKPLNAMVGQFIRIAIGQKPHPTEPDVVLDEVISYTKV